MACSKEDKTVELMGELDEEQQKLLKSLASAPSGAGTEVLKKLQEYAAKKMEAWKKQKVNVGIVGDPGAGKSTFINSIRELKPKQKGAAEVGLCHTTSEATEYPDPNRPNSLCFVDFPGVLLTKGTSDKRDFDIQQYLDEFGERMEQCHVFLVFSSGRIQHNAVQIGMKARDMGKKVLFIRSQFDKDLADKENDDPDYFEGKTRDEAVANLMEELRLDYISVLKQVGWEGEVRATDVFIISGRYNSVLQGHWDIPRFRKAMFGGLSGLQKMAVITTCRDFSKDTIKERGDILRRQMGDVAWTATKGSFVPFFGVTSVPDALHSAYGSYKEAFSLTDDTVEQLAKMTKKNPQDLKKFVSARLLAGTKYTLARDESFETVVVVSTICRELDMEPDLLEEVVTFFLPVIGAALNVPTSMERMLKVLDAMISRMEKCASDLFDHAFDQGR